MHMFGNMIFSNPFFSSPIDMRIDGKTVNEWFDDVFEKYTKDLNDFKSSIYKTAEISKEEKKEKTTSKSMEKAETNYFVKMLSQPKLSLKEHEAKIDSLIREYLSNNEEAIAKADKGIIIMQFADTTIAWLYDRETLEYWGYILDSKETYDVSSARPLIKELEEKDPALYYSAQLDELIDHEGNLVDKPAAEENKKENTKSSDDANKKKDKTSYYEIFDALYKALEPFAGKLIEDEKNGRHFVNEFYNEFWNILGGKKETDDEDIVSIYDEDNDLPEDICNKIDDSPEDICNKIDNSCSNEDYTVQPCRAELYDGTLCERFNKKVNKLIEEKEKKNNSAFTEEISEDEYVGYLTDVVLEYLDSILEDDQHIEISCTDDKDNIYIAFALDEIDALDYDMRLGDTEIKDLPASIFAKTGKKLKEAAGFKNVWFYDEKNSKGGETGRTICKCQIK